MNVFEILKARILSGNFKLMDMQGRIDTSFARGSLTAEQTQQLSALALEKASKEGEMPAIMDILTALSQRISALEEKTDMEENAGAYPVWKPWDGISSLYQKGAVVSHKGKLYQSVFPGQNVWEPGVAGTESLWKTYEGEDHGL